MCWAIRPANFSQSGGGKKKTDGKLSLIHSFRFIERKSRVKAVYKLIQNKDYVAANFSS